MQSLSRSAVFLAASLLITSACVRPRVSHDDLPTTAADELAEQPRSIQQEAIGMEVRRLLLGVSDSTLIVAERELPSAALLRSFYSAQDFRPVWALQPVNEEDFISFISGLEDFGLRPSDYWHPLMESEDVDDIRLMGEKELILSNAYFELAKHISFGKANPSDTLNQQWFATDELPDLAASLARGLERKELSKSILALQPQHPEYLALLDALQSFRKLYPCEDSFEYKLPNFRQDSVLAYDMACDILLEKGFMDSTQASEDSLFLDALRHFQIMHNLEADAQIGKQTAKMLGISNKRREEKLALSLERWRWESDWAKEGIYVNIPSYTLRMFGSPEHEKIEHRVVVGTADNATPELDAEVEYIISFPYWHVPYSISSEELLPKQKQDSSYLDRNSYTVFDRSGEVVDAGSVDWTAYNENNFPYRIRQDGGSFNSLGLLKIIFPNKHSVYLHDTNAKRYFGNDYRALSHGCVRLQNPVELAAYILQNDSSEINSDSLYHFIEERERKRIDLAEHLPIYLRYRSAAGGENGISTFYEDIYGLDEELAIKLGRRKTETEVLQTL